MDLRGASAEALVALTARLDDEIGTNRALRRSVTSCSRSASCSVASRHCAGSPPTPRSPPEAKQGMVQQVFNGPPDRADAGPARRERWPAVDALARPARRARAAQRDRGRPLRRRQGRSGHRRAVRAVRRSSTPTRSCATRSATPAARSRTRQRCSTRCSTPRPSRPRVTLAKQALAGTYRTFTAALATYRRMAAETQGETVATVRVARPLAAADQQRLTALAEQPVRHHGAPQRRRRPGGPRRPARGDRRRGHRRHHRQQARRRPTSPGRLSSTSSTTDNDFRRRHRE